MEATIKRGGIAIQQTGITLFFQKPYQHTPESDVFVQRIGVDSERFNYVETASISFVEDLPDISKATSIEQVSEIFTSQGWHVAEVYRHFKYI